MPDPVPDTGKTWGIPNVLWSLFATAAMTAAITYMQNANTAAIQKNGEEQVKHAEAQIAKADAQIAAQQEVKTEVRSGLSNVAEKVEASPVRSIVIEQKNESPKPAEAKAAPEGLNH